VYLRAAASRTCALQLLAVSSACRWLTASSTAGGEVEEEKKNFEILILMLENV
jgi:hypothetical protein